jgi:hypothetical protein
MVVMENVSRPLIALLVASVAFLAVWMVALKPSSGGSGGSGSGGSSAYQSAIAKAHQAVATSDAASAAHGGTVPGSPAAKPSASQTSRSTPTPSAPTASAPTASTPTVSPAVATHGATKLTTRPAPTAARHAPATPAQRLSTVEQALRTNKVLALLFYNRAAADDRAVKQELASVPTRKTHVVKLAVPLTELAQYTVVTNQVPVSASPTLVLIDRTQHATTIVGFADRFEIAHRVDDALAVK